VLKRITAVFMFITVVVFAVPVFAEYEESSTVLVDFGDYEAGTPITAIPGFESSAAAAANLHSAAVQVDPTTGKNALKIIIGGVPATAGATEIKYKFTPIKADGLLRFGVDYRAENRKSNFYVQLWSPENTVDPVFQIYHVGSNGIFKIYRWTSETSINAEADLIGAADMNAFTGENGAYINISPVINFKAVMQGAYTTNTQTGVTAARYGAATVFQGTGGSWLPKKAVRDSVNEIRFRAASSATVSGGVYWLNNISVTKYSMPEITAVSPENNSDAIRAEDGVSVYFNAPLSDETVSKETFKVYDEGGTLVNLAAYSLTHSKSANGSTVKLSLDENVFLPGLKYSVKIANVKADSENKLSVGDFTYNFEMFDPYKLFIADNLALSDLGGGEFSVSADLKNYRDDISGDFVFTAALTDKKGMILDLNLQSGNIQLGNTFPISIPLSASGELSAESKVVCHIWSGFENPKLLARKIILK
jgi:hypothetical protein